MDTAPIPNKTPSGIIPPKEYIRTFERDMEILKNGGTPDLKPLAKSMETQVPVKEASVPAPVPVIPSPPSIPKPEPAPIPKPESPLRPAEAPSVGEKLSPIETYANDFSQRMKDVHASTATVLAAEQDSRSDTPQNVENKPSRSNAIYVIAGVVILLLGGAGSYIAYTRYLTNVEPIILAPTMSTPIFVDEKEKITAIKPSTILQAIQQSITRSLAPNTVRLLYTDIATGSTSSPQATTDNSVFSALQLPAPGVLLRNVNSARSMTGIVNSDGTQSLFFILSVASYSDTFAGMLSWEPTMPRDLSAFFPTYQQISMISTTSTSSGQTNSSRTTTVATSTLPVRLVFHDEVVNNHDARIYLDAEGRSILIYGYWNQTTLVIARDPAAFMEIIGRLATARTKN